jgi:hypothetical protein
MKAGDPYAFAERDGIELHLTQVDDLKPKRNIGAVYLYVDDADALYREWSRARIDGRLVEPSDTSYGLREGACLDRDANLIRFRSGIGSGDSGTWVRGRDAKRLARRLAT